MILHDTARLLWLKKRHLRTALVRLFYCIGSDILIEKDLFDRLYQFYLLIVVAASFGASLFALVDFIKSVFSALDPSITLLLIGSTMMIPLSIFVMYFVKVVKSPPFAFTLPDLFFVAAQPIKFEALAMTGIATLVLRGATAASLVAFLLSFGFQSSLELFPAAEFIVLSALMTIAALLSAYLLGIIRWSLEGKNLKFYFLFLIGSMGVLAVIYGVFALSNPSFFTAIPPIIFGNPLPFLLGFGGLTVVEITAIIIASSRMKMASIIDASNSNAIIAALKYLSMYDSRRYGDELRSIRRQRRLARFNIEVPLLFGEGRWALVSRSSLSFLRQFEGIPLLFFWGMLVSPAAIFLIIYPVNLIFWLYWALFILMLPFGAREATRVFKSDCSNRMFRDHFAFSTVTLFVANVIVPFLFISVISVITVSLLLGITYDLLWALPLSALINATIILCYGVGDLILAGIRKRISYEITLFICIVILVLAGLFTSPIVIVFLALLCVAALLYLMSISEEVM